MVLGKSSHRKADERTGNEATQVTHVVHISAERRNARSKKKIYADKENHATGERAFFSNRNGEIAKLHAREKGSSNSENSSRRPNLQVSGIVRDAK